MARARAWHAGGASGEYRLRGAPHGMRMGGACGRRVCVMQAGGAHGRHTSGGPVACGVSVGCSVFAGGRSLPRFAFPRSVGVRGRGCHSRSLSTQVGDHRAQDIDHGRERDAWRPTAPPEFPVVDSLPASDSSGDEAGAPNSK